MDYLIQQFIGATRRFGKILDEIKNHVESIAKTSQAANERNQPPPILRAELQVPHTINVQEQPTDTHKIGREWFKAIVEALTLVAVVAYAIINARMLHEMKKATEATETAAHAAKSSAKTAATTLESSKQQFRLEQRPYMWTEAAFYISDTVRVDRYRRGLSNVPPGLDELEKNVPFYINIHMVAGGRSPAIHVENTKPMLIFDSLDKAKRRARKFVPRYKGNNLGVVLVPGQSNVMPPAEGPRLTDQLINDLLTTKAIYVVGAIKYTDIFEPRLPPYETVYCYRILPRGMAFADCGFTMSIK